jgi:hypothetical protein
VCKSKQVGQIYRRFLPFLTLKRQREREEKFFLACLPHTNIYNGQQRSLCREEHRASNGSSRFDFPFSSSARREAKHKDERKGERENRWKRNDVVTVACQIGKYSN